MRVGDRVVVRFPQAICESEGVEMEPWEAGEVRIPIHPGFVDDMNELSGSSYVVDTIGSNIGLRHDSFNWNRCFLEEESVCAKMVKVTDFGRTVEGKISPKDLDLLLRYYERRGWTYKKIGNTIYFTRQREGIVRICLM